MIQKIIPAGCAYVIPQTGTQIVVLPDSEDVTVKQDETTGNQLAVVLGETGKVLVQGIVYQK